MLNTGGSCYLNTFICEFAFLHWQNWFKNSSFKSANSVSEFQKMGREPPVEDHCPCALNRALI